MKVGDMIEKRGIKGRATVVEVNVSQTFNSETNRPDIRTRYLALYPNGNTVLFYGFNIGKNITKVSDANSVQMSMFD